MKNVYSFPHPTPYPELQPQVYHSEYIQGLILAQLARYPDERGYFMEGTRASWFDGMSIKQVSFGLRHTGVANGWHIHTDHDEVLIALTGSVRLVFRDCRKENMLVCLPNGERKTLHFEETVTRGSEEWYLAGEHYPLAIYVPRGVAHGYKVFDTSLMVYQSTQEYEPSDEFRIDPNRWGSKWYEDPEIK